MGRERLVVGCLDSDPGRLWCTRGYWTAMSFMEIFQPGLKYLREERDRRRMDVAYPTNGGNPPIEIDLDAGTATILVPAPDRVEESADGPSPSSQTPV